ncbi:eukaryotic translation initiation factor 5B-like isoform X1 [Nasonia vitripennis]|uniref:PDZ domain-containing protein n=3 Tax=Nasonia vitripennis TaxID=7425 RepID=A0A7M7Q1G0_NASVI|nr:eukaryotic translation initiation factor 5B-like isoform X1 [Nasonia vitripennis]XP_031779134.1 eukaryotic translation initiation factor 5B-like isoform X1 [Nasonia vitripennis]
MATLDIKFTKFDNRPWGFRLAGGSDFPEPLTVIRVSEGSLAECMGLKVGDVVVKLNDQPISELTHGQAHEALVLAGNNFVLGVRRTEDPNKTVEGIEEKIEPYMLPLEEILFAPIEGKRETTPDEAPQIEDESAPVPEPEPSEPVELYPEKPRDENSEPLPKSDLTDEQIAQLILEEEEVLNEQGVLGVNFKKLRPRAPLLKESKVFQVLQQEASSEPAQLQELKRQTTFLQKPERPVPKPRRLSQSEEAEPEVEPYRVLIRKQPRKSVTERLLERGLLDPSRANTPEKATPPTTPEPRREAQGSEVGDSRPQSQAEVIEIVESTEEDKEQSVQEPEPRVEEPAEEESAQVLIRRPSAALQDVDVEVAVTMDRDKIKELVTTEISLERQLESVQSQLMALKQLPSEIEKHLKIVSEQLHKIMELSGVEAQEAAQTKEAEEEQREEEEEEEEEEKRRREAEEERKHEDEEPASLASQDESSSWAPHLISTEDTWTDLKELEISVKSNEDDGKRVKKYIVTYESKLVQEMDSSRSASPALSQKSFEPDPKLTLQDQLVQELKHRKGRKPARDLWQPQARQLELTYGRKWRCPNDFFNDEMIADVLSSQAEVIRGRALGVNFKKFEKTALPNYDHLMNSSVYKMIHKMEAEPKKGIPARPPKVIAAEDIVERVNTPVCCMADDRSVRSGASH